MIANPDFFHDLAYVFLAALLGGGLAWVRVFGLPEQIAAFAEQADARA